MRSPLDILIDHLPAPDRADGTLPLLRRLRIKFIAVNMALATLVLTGSFAAICYMDYRSDTDDVYRTLAQAANRAIERPQLVPEKNPLLPFEEAPANDTPGVPHIPTDPADPNEQPEGTATPQDSAAPDANATTESGEGFAPPQIGGDPRTGGETPLPMAVYYCENGTAVALPEYSSASVPEAVLVDALTKATAATASRGLLDSDGLFFAKQTVGPATVVAFADSAAAESWKSLALVLAGVGVGALAILFLLNLVFSRWALRPVQQAWTQQQQFVADASHELKTPLTVILANNAILRKRKGETVASQAQWIESTQMEAERMQGLVTDMLDLARSSAAAAAVPRTPVNFSRLVDGEALTFESVAFERGLTWESTVQSGLDVAGDERRLQRLVAVLLDNACKYTNPGGCVEVTLCAEERVACLRVRNTGDVIAEEDLAHLFDRFYRVDKARTHGALAAGASAPLVSAKVATPTDPNGAPNGYGLGLAIARDIAQAHRGTLSVTSTAEEGTIFTLRLPLA